MYPIGTRTSAIGKKFISLDSEKKQEKRALGLIRTLLDWGAQTTEVPTTHSPGDLPLPVKPTGFT